LPALTILAICRSDLGLGQPVDKLKFLARWSGADDEEWPNHKGEGPGRDRDASAAVIDRPLQRTAPRLGYRSLREFDAAHGRPRLCPAVRGLQQNSSTCPHGLPLCTVDTHLTTGQKTRAYRQLLKADPNINPIGRSPRWSRLTTRLLPRAGAGPKDVRNSSRRHHGLGRGSRLYDLANLRRGHLTTEVKT
jgi:hypothetical protein